MSKIAARLIVFEKFDEVAFKLHINKMFRYIAPIEIGINLPSDIWCRFAIVNLIEIPSLHSEVKYIGKETDCERLFSCFALL
jgi:hypothetical protein